MHVKTIIALISSLPLTIAVNFMKYIFQDWEFAKWIGIAIALDTIVSLVKHFITKDISSETFWAKFAKKIFVYLILLIASNYLTNYTVNGHIIGPTLWIGEYICVYILIRETISLIENINAITPILPPALLKRLKDFNERGEYIKPDNKEGNTILDNDNN